MAIINVRRVRDAFVRAEVTDEANGLELATSLDEELSETFVTNERLETLEDRIDSRFALSEQRVQAAFAQAEAQAERRMLRFLLAIIAAQALFAGIIAILLAVL